MMEAAALLDENTKAYKRMDTMMRLMTMFKNARRKAAEAVLQRAINDNDVEAAAVWAARVMKWR
jgi:hypothetical protein